MTYNLDFKYIPGRYKVVADALSCFPVEDGTEEEQEEEVISINRVFLGQGGEEIIPHEVKDLARKGKSDEDYMHLVSFFEGTQDWGKVKGEITAYKDIADQVSIEEFDGAKLLIVDGVRIIPPHSCRKDLIKTLHATQGCGHCVALCQASFSLAWHEQHDQTICLFM